MPKSKLNIVGGAYEMRATQLDAQTSINWYATVDNSGKFNSALLPRPGLTLFIDDDNEKSVRGLFTIKGILYAVIDNSFYSCTSNGSRNKKGTLNTTQGLVRIIANDYQLFITDGQYGYVFQIIGTEIHEEEEFFVVENASSVIDTPEFFGEGIDDLSASGIYLGATSKTYRVQIDSIGITDTFRWSDDDGLTWNNTNVSITGATQLLNEGVFVSFLNETGHILGDYWTIEVTIGSSFYIPIYPTYQDGYGIYPKQNTNQFFLSSINDFSRVDPLDFAYANVYADNLIASLTINDEVYLLGEIKTEIWYNTGAQDFPFGRRRNIVLNYGCEAPFTAVVGADNIIFMLARNFDGGRVIVNIINYGVKIISTEAINEELRLYDKVSDAFSFLIERNGHIFYIITFPTVNKTWVYDILTNLWHEWKSVIPKVAPSPFDKKLGRFRGNCHTVFNGQDIIGDSISGKIFILDERSNLDYDELLICERTIQHSSENNEYITVNSLEIDGEMGIGNETGYGSDPKIMLQISRDGGKSWGSELWNSAGKIGEYTHRAIWYRLGSGRVFTIRFRMCPPVYKAIFGAIIEAEAFD